MKRLLLACAFCLAVSPAFAAQQTISGGVGIVWGDEKDKINANFDELYGQAATKWVTGTAYTADNQMVMHDGNLYVCTSNHTAGATTEPGTGADWATVWAYSGAALWEPIQTAASQGEMEAGTELAIRSMSPLRVAQAIAAQETDDQNAGEVATDTTNFDNNLSATDTSVQAALETLDELAGGGASAIDDLTDVDTTGKATGKVLKFDASGNLVVGDDEIGAEGTGDITGVTAGTGLSGGGDTGAVTLNIADTAVTPGSYTNTDLTVDQQGRITAAASGTDNDSFSSYTVTTTVGDPGSDTNVPSEQGVREAIDAISIPTASSLSVDDLITLSGVAEGSINLGLFSGSTITDDITIKAALQELETAVEGAAGGHDAVTINAATAGLTLSTQEITLNEYIDDMAEWTDPDADRIWFWDDSAGYFTGLTVGNGLSISTTTVALDTTWLDDQSITWTGTHTFSGTVNLPAAITLPNESVDSDQYVDGSIDAVHLAADIVDETKIADDGIDSEHYNDGSIDAVHLSFTAAPGAGNDDYAVTYDNASGGFTLVELTGGAETNSLETTITGIADTEIFVGDGADSGAFVVMSGDATLANTGALTIAANAIENGMMADNAIDSAEITSGAVDISHLGYGLTYDLVIESPADADAFLFAKAPNAITITDIHCIATSGTSVVIDIQECDSAGANCATVDAAITCDTDGAEDDGTLTNGAIDAGDWIKLDIGTVTGEVTQVAVSIYY